jgi:hypothetical protein
MNSVLLELELLELDVPPDELDVPPEELEVPPDELEDVPPEEEEVPPEEEEDEEDEVSSEVAIAVSSASALLPARGKKRTDTPTAGGESHCGRIRQRDANIPRCHDLSTVFTRGWEILRKNANHSHQPMLM